MQIKTTVSNHLSEWPSSINQQTTSAGEDVEQGKPFCMVDGDADRYSHNGKQHGRYLNILKMELPYEPVIPLLGIYPKKPKTLIQNNISTPMFIAVLFTTAKLWKRPKCPSIDNKTTVAHLHSGILLCCKQEENFTLCDSMDGPGEHNAE